MAKSGEDLSLTAKISRQEYADLKKENACKINNAIDLIFALLKLMLVVAT
jgi:hypothetical protein